MGNRRFLYRSAIYAIGDLLTKGSRFLLVPLYAYTFTQADMGLIAILTAITTASQTMLGLGLTLGVRRFHVDYDHTPESADRFVSTMFWTRAALSLPLLAVLIAATFVYCRSSDSVLPIPLTIAALLTGYFRAGSNIAENALIVREEPVKYRALTSLQFLSVAAAVMVAVLVLDLGFEGAIFGELIATSIWCVAIGIYVTRQSQPSFREFEWRTIWRHCLPAVPYLTFMWALASSDRLLLERFRVSTDRIAVYEIGYLLATALSVFSIAMQSAWFPRFFRTADQSSSRAEYGRTANLYFAVVAFAAVSMILVAPELVAIVAPSTYSYAVTITRVVVLGTLFLTMFMAFSQPLLYANRTVSMALAAGLGLIVNLVANVILIPKYGILGSAIATVAAYSAIAIVALVCAQKTFHVEWDIESSGLLIACAGLVTWLGLSIGQDDRDGLPIRVGCVLGLAAANGLIVWRRSKPTAIAPGVRETTP